MIPAYLSNGVMTSSVIVCSIFLPGDDLFGVVKLAISTGSHFVTHSGLKIDVNSARDVLSCTSFTEEGVESVVTSSDGLVRWHLAIRLDSVLEAVKFPAAVTSLNTGLAHMNRDTFCSNEGMTQSM